jgi:hypothetical protein
LVRNTFAAAETMSSSVAIAQSSPDRRLEARVLQVARSPFLCKPIVVTERNHFAKSPPSRCFNFTDAEP